MLSFCADSVLLVNEMDSNVNCYAQAHGRTCEIGLVCLWTFIEGAVLEWNGIIVPQELSLKMFSFINKCSQRHGWEGGS